VAGHRDIEIEIAVDTALARAMIVAVRGLIEVRDNTQEELTRLAAGKALRKVRKELRGG